MEKGALIDLYHITTINFRNIFIIVQFHIANCQAQPSPSLLISE